MTDPALLFVCEGGRPPAGAKRVLAATTAAGYRCVTTEGAGDVLERVPGGDREVEGTIVEIGLGELGRAVEGARLRLDVVELLGGEHALGLLAASASRESWDHSSLAVGDLDLALDFYRGLLGFEVAFVERGMADQIAGITGLPGLECDIAQLRSPRSTHVLELIAFRGVPPDRADHAPTSPGRGHVAFRMEDLDLALEQVRRLGGHTLGAVTRFEDGDSAYCREPSGSFLELSAPRATAPGAPAGRGPA